MRDLAYDGDTYPFLESRESRVGGASPSSGEALLRRVACATMGALAVSISSEVETLKAPWIAAFLVCRVSEFPVTDCGDDGRYQQRVVRPQPMGAFGSRRRG